MRSIRNMKRRNNVFRVKVSRVKVTNLLAKGLTQAEVAETLGCTRRTINNIVRERKIVKTTAVTLGQDNAIRLLDNSIDAMAQLNKTNAGLLEEMDKIKDELVSCGKGDRKEIRDVQIKYLGEHRKQIKLLLEIYATTHQIQEVHAFQKVVMDVIRDIDPEAAREIISRLKAEQFVNKDLRL